MAHNLSGLGPFYNLHPWNGVDLLTIPPWEPRLTTAYSNTPRHIPIHGKPFSRPGSCPIRHQNETGDSLVGAPKGGLIFGDILRILDTFSLIISTLHTHMKYRSCQPHTIVIVPDMMSCESRNPGRFQSFCDMLWVQCGRLVRMQLSNHD